MSESRLLTVKNSENILFQQSYSVNICDTFFRRLVGALSLRKIPPGQLFWFPGCRSIHTLGMIESIDLCFPDQQGTILRYESSLQPWRICPGPKLSAGVIELPPSSLPPQAQEPGCRIELSGLIEPDPRPDSRE